ncbi:MAG: hypothetical protein ACLRFE_03005 [Clostridia bacterium]
MKKLKKSLLLSIVGCFAFFVAMLSGCGKDKITLSTTDDVTKLKPGEGVQLLIDGKTPDGFTFRINEGSDYAEIDENGVLTISVTAEPGDIVKVLAEKNSMKSNEITIVVDSIDITAIEASAEVTEVMRNNFYELSSVVTPANATEQVSWVILQGGNYAEISGRDLKIKSTAPYNTIIKVQAQGKNVSSNILEFKVVEYSESGLYLDGYDEITRLDAAETPYVYKVGVYNENSQLVLGKTLGYSLSTEDQQILSVTKDGYDFTLRAIGHGVATLRITLGEVYKDVEVNCIKAPEALMLPQVVQTKKDIDFSTGINQEISNFNVGVKGENVCSDVTYTFEKRDGSNWTSSTAGTFNDGKIKFTEEGKFKVTATSVSGSILEKSVSMQFTVNDGINVSTFAELQTALINSTGKTINIVNMQTNKLTPIISNVQDILNVKTTVASGDLKLFGNGYEVDLSSLSVVDAASGDLGTFLKISGAAKEGNAEADHKVVIKDVAFKGNSNLSDSNSKGKYFRAIEIGGDKDEISYLVDIKNVKISQFGVGLRVSHAVSYNEKNTSSLYNVTVENTWSNGIETAACQIVLDSINLGLCGGCGMEVTPDSFNKAGLLFNQAQNVKFVGTWNANNLNNGETPYFASMNLSGLTVPMLINGSIAANLGAKSNVVNDEGKLNMIALVFNDVSGFPTISPNGSEITDNAAFASSMINYSDIDGVDTTHKYIEVNLVYETYNLGSVILYNFNYQG